MISKVPLSVKRCSDAPPTVPRWPVDGGAVHRWGQPCWHISQMPQLVDLKQTVRYTEVASRDHRRIRGPDRRAWESVRANYQHSGCAAR